jgi:hypothetical protein
VEGFCEHENEHSVSVKLWKLLSSRTTARHFKNVLAPFSYLLS